MALKSVFEIESSGLIKEVRSIENYINLLSGKVRNIGKITFQDVRKFGNIGYTITWKGVLTKITDVDLVYKQFKRYSENYLTEWKIVIKIRYQEGGNNAENNNNNNGRH